MMKDVLKLNFPLYVDGYIEDIASLEGTVFELSCISTEIARFFP
jgi:hypothetical protein